MDVAFWLQCREFHGKPAVTDAIDFVIVDGELHNDFDAFKRQEVKPSYSWVPVSELLLFSQFTSLHNLPEIIKFGKCYFELHVSQMDELISWAVEMRERYISEGESVLENGIERMLSSNGKALLDLSVFIININL